MEGHSLAADLVSQGGSLDAFHNDHVAAIHGKHVMNGNDIGMIEGRSGLRFAGSSRFPPPAICAASVSTLMATVRLRRVSRAL